MNEKFRELENALKDLPRTREISLALTKLEECEMWYEKSIAP